MIQLINMKPQHPKIMSFTKSFLLLLALIIAGCSKDQENTPELPPVIDKLEIGLNNNETGVIGKDFHFNAEVLVSGKIETVQIKILPRAGESYAKIWSYDITWDQYKDAKNATVHKHFYIPTDATEGKYDFIIIVNDQNGTKLELKKSLTIYAEGNVPVNPAVSIFNVFRNDERYYRNGKFIIGGAVLSKNDKFTSQVSISGVKGDGKMYLLLINAKLNHRPESIAQIDFSKVIVYDVYEHKGWANAEVFSNAVVDLSTNTSVRIFPNMTIGGTTDNNLPSANPVSGIRAWESGTYYYGVVYQNSTYNIAYYSYIKLPIVIN
jgi:hypothetical protein